MSINRAPLQPKDQQLKFIIEFEGLIAEVADAYYHAYTLASRDVGWSKLERGEYWRRLRKQGRLANLLTGAKPVKIEEFWKRFDERLESDETVNAMTPVESLAEVVRRLQKAGECMLVTMGANVDARCAILTQWTSDAFYTCFERLSNDARQRPAELLALSGNVAQTVVVASSDTLIRAAGVAELFSVAIAMGAVSKARLLQASPSIEFANASELAEEIAAGGGRLVEAGLPSAEI